MKCLQKKTKRQIVLNGALHLSYYVTKVMKRHSDQSVAPKFVLEFVFQAERFKSWEQSWESNPSLADSLSHQSDALLQRAMLPRIPLQRDVGREYTN